MKISTPLVQLDLLAIFFSFIAIDHCFAVAEKETGKRVKSVCNYVVYKMCSARDRLSSKVHGEPLYFSSTAIVVPHNDTATKKHPRLAEHVLFSLLE